jgi:hypothetical protein
MLRGVTDNPRLTLLNGAEGISLPFRTQNVYLGVPENTLILLSYLVVCAYILATAHGSRAGRTWAAVRLDEAAASTLGIDAVRYKLLAFTLGAALAAGAGALSAPVVRVIDPNNYAYGRAVEILAFGVLGGTAHWSGPILGALVLTGLPEALRFLREHRDIANGLVIMAAIIWLPRGIGDPRFWRGLVDRARLLLRRPSTGDWQAPRSAAELGCPPLITGRTQASARPRTPLVATRSRRCRRGSRSVGAAFISADWQRSTPSASASRPGRFAA